MATTATSVSLCLDVLGLGLDLGAAQVIVKFCLDAERAHCGGQHNNDLRCVEAELSNDLRCAEDKAEVKDVNANTDLRAAHHPICGAPPLTAQ